AAATGFAGDSDRRRADLLEDVFALAHELAGDHGCRWLVETEDAYRIAVSLMAAAVVGARIVLPPNLQAGTLEELRRASDRVFTEDCSDGLSGVAAMDPIVARAGR